MLPRTGFRSSAPHFGQVASPNKIEGSTQTSELQIGRWAGSPSGVRDEICLPSRSSKWNARPLTLPSFRSTGARDFVSLLAPSYRISYFRAVQINSPAGMPVVRQIRTSVVRRAPILRGPQSRQCPRVHDNGAPVPLNWQTLEPVRPCRHEYAES